MAANPFMNMRILFLTLYYAPDPAANAVIITRLAEDLQAKGHEVTVICAMPHYDTNCIWPAYRKKLIQHERSTNGIDIYRVWLHVPKKKRNLLGRLLNYISFNIMSTLAGLFVRKPDVIITPSPPLTIGLSAWLLGLLRQAPYVYNVQDIYPDVAVRLGALTNPRIIRAFEIMERFIYRHAKAITVISHGFKRNLLAKKVPEAKLAIIPNFVDTDFVTPCSKNNEIARRESLVGPFVVLFAGNVGLSQGLEHVLDAAHALRHEQDIQFLIVGNGSSKPHLEEQAALLGLSNVKFLPFLPREDVPNLYASSDLCLIPLRKGIAQESVPSKALTIMAAGRPILASVDTPSDIADLIERAGCGVCVPPEDPESLAGAILELRDARERCQTMGAKGRDYVCEHFAPEKVSQQYAYLLADVVGVSLRPQTV